MKTNYLLLFISSFVLLISSHLYAQREQQDMPKYLKFSYDESGNQIERIYTSTIIVAPKQSEEELIEESLASQFEEMLKIYPNPTRGVLNIEWEKEITQYISQIEILSSDAILSRNLISNQGNKLSIDLTSKQPGIYFVRYTFTDGSIVSQKAIKL